MVCPFRDAELAVKTFEKHRAAVQWVSYKGGHGWRPFPFYGESIREGIAWLKESNQTGPRPK
jgi:hypothetical protein